jgi:hypothetical protein
MRRFVFSFLLATTCAVVVATRVYVDLERVRTRVINAPVPAPKAPWPSYFRI